MRFLLRGLGGLLLLGLTLGLLLLAAGEIGGTLRERAERRPPPRPPAERVVAVRVLAFEVGRAHPVIATYGTVEGARMLELRAAVPGPLVELAPDFRDGAAVAEGALLWRIDPRDAESARDAAAAALAEAEAEIAEAAAALALAQDELAAADRQRELRAQALARQRELQGRRVATDAAVEAAELALSAAEQALLGRRQALAQAEARVTRAGLARDRARLALADAARSLADTEARAPFAGLLADTSAIRGRRVAANEILGRLIDPAALEVAFRVSNAEFARLVDGSGALLPLAVTVTLDLGPETVTHPGRLARSGALVGPGQTGRLLYARLDPAASAVLRPGDFVAVAIAEPPLDGVAVIPAAAVTEDGRVLVLTPEDRLREVTLRILRRERDRVIVADAPAGERFVAERQPALGPGLKVRPTDPARPVAPVSDLIRLTPERRAALIAAVEANPRLPAEARARLLAELRQEAVPRQVVERIEARAGGG